MRRTTLTTADGGSYRAAALPRWPVATMSLLFAAEAVVFFAHVSTQIAPFYPRNFDQTSYLVDTYDLAQQIRSVGALAIVSRYFSPNATGVSFIVQGALIALVSGYNRTALYGLNLVYFVALQLALFHSICRQTQKPVFAWLGIVLLLSATTILNDPGGMYDYRIDFAALCLYGIWCCFVIDTNAFQSKGGVFVVAATGVLLVSLRTITAVYLAVIFVGLLAVSLADIWRNWEKHDSATRSGRFRNTLAAAILTGLAVSPLLFAARHAIYDYYWVGHVLNQEKYIRSAENHLSDIWDHLLFYPRSILVSHLGKLSVALWLVALALTVAQAMGLAGGPLGCLRTRLGAKRFEFVALGLAIVVPVVLLTADVSKSAVVGGITTVPIILCGVLLLSSLRPNIATADDCRQARWFANPAVAIALRDLPRAGRKFAPVAIGIFCIALFITRGATASRTWPAKDKDQEHIAELNIAIDRYVIDNAIKRPTESFDRVVDYLNNGTLILFGYERFHRRIDFDPRFGHGTYGIFATPRDVALGLLAESDVIVLTDPVLGRELAYPMNTAIRAYWPDLWAWAKQNRTPLFQTTIFGVPHTVFARPTSNLSGSSR